MVSRFCVPAGKMRNQTVWVLLLFALVAFGCTPAMRSVQHTEVPSMEPGAVHASHERSVHRTSPLVSREQAKTLRETAGDALQKPEPGLEAPILPEPGATRCKLPSVEEQAFGLYAKDPWPRGEVVLTFDDGPHPTLTPRVLNLLAKHDMQATFFVVGRAINRKTFHLLQRMVGEGHTVGVHSYNHDVDMSRRVPGERTIAYVHGQHEVTQILVDLALLATSPDHFDQLYQQVFGRSPLVYLPSSSLRTEREVFVERHERLLASYGLGQGQRVYPVLYSRPPGGAPYLGLSETWSKDAYDTAMGRLGMLNVMWHGGAGDTDPDKRSDFGFLYGNMQHHTRRGGVILIHDYIRSDALAAALRFIASDSSIRVVSIDEAVRRKYGCAVWALRDRLRHPRPADRVVLARPQL